MANKPCGCGGQAVEFDARAAIARLTDKVERLAEVLARVAASSSAAGAAAAPMALMAPASRGARAAPAADIVNFIQRIVGGTRTNDYPECCLLGHRYPNYGMEWFCTGVLVHPRIVLTAGHCFMPQREMNIVALGTSDQNQLQSAEIVEVRQAHVHPQYIQTQRVADITVLVLKTPATAPSVVPATTAELAAATRTTLVGFGNSDVNSSYGFGLKREVTVDIRSVRRTAADALDADEHKYGYESDLEFVAGGDGFDSCQGDSGGPAYILVGGIRKVAGLTSRGTDDSPHKCGDGGIYTRVDQHLGFIREVAAGAKITDLAF